MKQTIIKSVLCAAALSWGLNAAQAATLVVTDLTVPHLQEYDLNTAIGYVIAVQLPSNEKLDQLAVGDSVNWRVSIKGNIVYVSPTVDNKGTGTNLLIKTDKQLHNLKFTIGDKPPANFKLQLTSLEAASDLYFKEGKLQRE